MLRQVKFALLGLLLLPTLTFAGLFTGFSNPYNHFYANVGTVGYYLQQPKFEVGTKGTGTPAVNTTAPLAKININHIAPLLHLEGGYWFMNCHDNWLTRIFGNEEAFEADLDYLYFSTHDRRANLGTGNIWYIDGSRGISNTGSPISLTNFKLSSTLNNINTGVYFKGKVYTTNPKLIFVPKVGIINNYYINKYRYSVNYTNTGTDTETFDVNTYYYGLAFGGKLNYQIARHFMPFASLEVQLLNIHANLDATQDTGQNQIITVNDSENTFNYRAIGALGVQYKFNDTLKSPSLILKGGLDHWNYVPRVVPPNRAGDQAVHLHGESMNNGFMMFGVTVPFG